jgi:hypothetical protein
MMLKAQAKGNKIKILIKWKDQPAADSSWKGSTTSGNSTQNFSPRTS